jgi:hypothetical protein
VREERQHMVCDWGFLLGATAIKLVKHQAKVVSLASVFILVASCSQHVGGLEVQALFDPSTRSEFRTCAALDHSLSRSGGHATLRSRTRRCARRQICPALPSIR